MRVIVLSLLGLLLSPSAAAEVVPQANFQVTGSSPIGAHSDVGMFASVMFAPGADPLVFTYAGPGVQVTKWWWTSPRIGLEMNIPASGDARPIFSLWNALTLADGHLSLFLETEVYPDLSPAKGDPVYYGFYSATVTPKTRLSFGAQVEQVNASIAVGPQIGFKFNPSLSAGVQHFWDFNDGHAIRVVAAVAFN